MKVLGFVLLQLSALLFAVQCGRAERQRTEHLRSFCAMLEHLLGLLESEAPPMPAMLSTLADRSKGAAELFLLELSASMDQLGALSFRELWKNALAQTSAGTDAETLRDLEALGNILGRYELKRQLDAAAACHTSLRRRLDRSAEELRQKRRLLLGLSLSTAALVGIILL